MREFRTKWYCLFSGIGLLFLIYWVQLIVRHPVAYDITESVLFHRALLLSGGENIYPLLQSAPYFVTPYTPLAFFIVSILIKIFGPVLWLGRVTSLLAFFGTLFACAYLIKEKCGGYLRSLCFMSLLLCSYHVISNALFIYNQWVGIFLSVLGLAMLSRRPYFAFFIMSLGIMARQSQFLAPMAALIWFASKDFRQAFMLGLFFCVCTVLELIVTGHFFGSTFFQHIFTYTVGTYSLADFERLAAYCILPYILFVVIGALIIYKRVKMRELDLLSIYLLLNTLWLFAALRSGSASNYFLEFYLALFLVIMPVIHSGAMKKTAIIQLVMIVVFTAYMLHWNGARVAERDLAVKKIVPILKKAAGDVIVEDPILAIESGHRLYLEGFPMTSLVSRGLWDQGAFVKDLEDGKFAAVVLQFDVGSGNLYFTAKERFTEEMRDALRTGYILKDKIDPFYLYFPKN